MNYITKSLHGQHSLFFYTGVGKEQKTSYLYKDGKIVLFTEEQNAVQVGDKIKLGHADVDEAYTFEPNFLKAAKK